MALVAVVLRLSLRLRSESDRSSAALTALRHELTGLEQGRSHLERLSSTDPVTGVWNYRYLQNVLNREIDRARHSSRPLALLMCDIDQFSQVNARYGHQRGSAVLRELAQRLSLEIRRFDTFSRYGGEEFVVLLPDTGPDGALAVAERLCYAVRRHPFDPGQNPEQIRLTVSVGVAVSLDGSMHAATLLRTADEALTLAKGAGGDRATISGSGNSAVSSSRSTHSAR